MLDYTVLHHLITGSENNGVPYLKITPSNWVYIVD
jgi:hypothetical protein